MGRGRFQCFDVFISVEVGTRPAGIISAWSDDEVEAGILRDCMHILGNVRVEDDIVVGVDESSFPRGHLLYCGSKVGDLDTDLNKG